MVEYADHVVGRIVEKLDELGLRENTLILFTGDNGTPVKVPSQWQGEVFQGGKGLLTDAGTHVPLVANWKGTTRSGEVNDSLIDFSDFFVTMAELSNAKLPQDRTIDGHSFVSQLKGVNSKGRDWVCTEWEGKRWVRSQRWKLYQSGELYDMTMDAMEETPITDVKNKEANTARKELQAALASLQT